MSELNIAITGASGRIGQVLTQHFHLHPKFRVFPISRETKDGFYSYDQLYSDDMIRKINVLIHLAWSTVPKVSEKNFGTEWNNDIPLLINLLQTIKSKNDNIHFIFFSSAGAINEDKGANPSNDQAVCSPANMYGWAKLHAEQLIQQFAKRKSISSTILRISNVYGIGTRNNDQQGIIPLLIKSAIDRSEMKIWGDGTAEKDYIHIDDVINALDRLILLKRTGTYNVSFGKSYSLLEVIARIEQSIGYNLHLNFTDDYNWDNQHVAVDNCKLKDAISWSPEIDLEHGIQRMIKAIYSGKN